MPDRLKPTTVWVCMEAGSRRTFASALEWPGWSRSGRGEEAALDTLAAYAVRYARVAQAAGLGLPIQGGSSIWSGSRARQAQISGCRGAFPKPSASPRAPLS